MSAFSQSVVFPVIKPFDSVDLFSCFAPFHQLISFSCFSRFEDPFIHQSVLSRLLGKLPLIGLSRFTLFDRFIPISPFILSCHWSVSRLSLLNSISLLSPLRNRLVHLLPLNLLFRLEALVRFVCLSL